MGCLDSKPQAFEPGYQAAYGYQQGTYPVSSPAGYTPGPWQCTRCTLENAAGCMRCSACGSSRPIGVTAVPPVVPGVVVNKPYQTVEPQYSDPQISGNVQQLPCEQHHPHGQDSYQPSYQQVPYASYQQPCHGAYQQAYQQPPYGAYQQPYDQGSNYTYQQPGTMGGPGRLGGGGISTGMAAAGAGLAGLAGGMLLGEAIDDGFF
jgi:hypothetical protein